MTDHRPTADEQPADLAAFAADTLLLDALGNGEPAPSGERVATLLAGWRADLDTGLVTADGSEVDADPEVARLIAAAGIGTVGIDAAGIDVAGIDAGLDGAAAGTDVRPAAGARRRARGPHRVARRVLGVAAAVLAAGGGLIIGAGHATPGSPLWPVTRVVYRDQADTTQVEQILGQARKAAAEGRVADARRLLAQADSLIARMSDPDQAKQLRAEAAAVRGLLPVVAPSTSAPAAPPAPTGGPGTGPGVPTTGPGLLPTTTPQPNVTTGGGHILPPLGSVTSPGLPLPTLPPSVGPVPLPLPTGLLPKLP